MKIGIIDIGTNSSRLAVFNISGQGKKSLILERNVITRLGEGLMPGGFLMPEPMERTLKTLSDFLEEGKRAGVERFRAIGTAALRSAENRADFLRRAENLGVEVEVISGEDEGELVFRGVVSDIDNVTDPLLVLDIGGGSTELNWGVGGELEESESVGVGAVRMAEKHIKSDPPAASEREEIYWACENVFSEIYENRQPADDLRCIGVAGTITTLAMIDLELPEFDSEKVHGHCIDFATVERITGMLMGMTTKQRRAIPGMQPGRADIIHSGAAILHSLMTVFKLKSILVSERDIRYGLIEKEF